LAENTRMQIVTIALRTISKAMAYPLCRAEGRGAI